MKFKEWYEPNEFLEHALGGILAMNLELLIEGRKDPERLRQAKVTSTDDFKGIQPDLFSDQLPPDERAHDEEEARQTHHDQSGKRPEWKTCPNTPLSAYDREIKALQVAARSSPDTFAQIMMFSPLSANVNFGKHWDNVPVVYNLLVTMFPDKIKPKTREDQQLWKSFKGSNDQKAAKLVEKYLLPFNDPMYGMGATVSGWKYDTIAHIWNNRHELKDRLQKIADADGSDAELIMAMKDIPGVKPVKAGFIAQLLYGKAGCIDTHNIDIYGRTFPDMKGELDDKHWQKYGDDAATADTIQKYTGTLDKLKSRGIGTKELWDVWVDFVGRMYKAILPGGLYATHKGPALNPNEPKYQAVKTTVPKERILATGKKDRGNVVGIDTISGDDSGGGASLTHDLPRHHPHEMLKQAFKHQRGDADAADFPSAIIRQPKMMGPEPAGLHYFRPSLDQDTGNVDPDRLRDLIKGYGKVGVDRMKRKMAGKAFRAAEKEKPLFHDEE